MLNELYRLAQSLKAAGIQAPMKHPRVTVPGKSSGIAVRVRLDPSGCVTAVERITDDEWSGLWIIRNGNQNFFPVARLGFRASDGEWSEKDAALLGRLKSKAAELSEACAGHADLGFVTALCERFQRATERLQDLHDELGRRGSELLNDGIRYQFAFDVDHETAYRTQIREAVEQVLPLDDGLAGDHPALRCALTGDTSLHTGPFPTVKLPVLDKAFPLFSMFSDASCNYRYGLTKSSAVSIGARAALEMQNALAFIVDAGRKGRTWRGISNGHFEKARGRPRETQDLLIAYVENGVDLTAPIADLFGADPGSEAKQFESDASAVCDALRGLVRDAPASRLSILVLRAVSQGQVQVQLSAQPTAGDIISAAQSWQTGAKNVPPVMLRAPAPKGSGYLYLEPRTPHPDRLVSITSRQWLESGARWSASRGATFNQVITIMLNGPRWSETTAEVLQLVNNRTWPLMTGLFGAIYRLSQEESAKHGYPAESCRTALQVVSAYGILLYKLGHRKEEYMHEPPFLVGRLLALADLLHREHSRKERDSEPPPQMIGNALMPVARDDPTAAIARLNDRLPFYKAWAERSSDGLARWAVARLRETATDLERTSLPDRPTEAGRAQLILGYISRLSDSSEAEADDQTSGGENDR